MPSFPTGGRVKIFSASCPINNGRDCGRNNSALRRCFDLASAQNSVFNHIHGSPKPNHSIPAAQAREMADNVHVNDWSESEYEHLPTDDENELAPADDAAPREPREHGEDAPPPRHRHKRRRTTTATAGRSSGSRFEGPPARVHPLLDLGIGTELAQQRLSTIAPDNRDNDLVSLRRSQIKCLHDCIVRSAHSIRAAKSVCERATAAFELEAANVERIAHTLGSMI